MAQSYNHCHHRNLALAHIVQLLARHHCQYSLQKFSPSLLLILSVRLVSCIRCRSWFLHRPPLDSLANWSAPHEHTVIPKRNRSSRHPTLAWPGQVSSGARPGSLAIIRQQLYPRPTCFLTSWTTSSALMYRPRTAEEHHQNGHWVIDTRCLTMHSGQKAPSFLSLV